MPVNNNLILENVISIINKDNVDLIITNKKNKKILKKKYKKKSVNFLIYEELLKETNNKNKINISKKNLIDFLSKKLNLVDFNSDQLKIYTSGTTGVPKPVVHSYKSLFFGSMSFIKFYKLKNNSVFWNYLPMSYLGGYFNLFFLPIYCGGAIVISKSFNSNLLFKIVNILRKYKINRLWFTPDIANSFIEFVRSSRDVDYIKKSKIIFFIGMDYVHPSLKKNFFLKFNKLLYENYGLSETLFLTCDKSNKINGHSGRILNRVKLSIDKKNYPKEKFGEIVVEKSPTLKKKFFTGDLGWVSKNYLFYHSRKKDILIKGGINISPLEIENIFKKLNIVSRTCLVEIKNKFSQKKLVLVFKKNSQYKKLDYLEKIKKFSYLMVENFKRPDFFYEVNLFPVTSSGKIKRNILQIWLQKENLQNDHILVKSRSLLDENKKIKKLNISKILLRISQASSVKLNNEVYELKNKGKKIITMSLGEAFFKTPDFTLKNLPKNKINHYSHSRGLLSLRKNISSYYKTNFDYEFSPDKEIIITAGSKIAVYLVLRTILNPNDEVIIKEPSWVSYSEQIKLCGAKPIFVPYNESIFKVGQYISNKTKAIIINSPNNPTGKIYSFEELDYLYSLTKINNIYCVSDEAYSDFIPNNLKFLTLGSFEKEKNNLIIINSLSKNFSLSGWRIGYAIANSKLIDQMLKLNQHLVTCAPTILQYFVSKNFLKIQDASKPQILKLLEKRKKVEDYLHKKKIFFLEGKSTFYFFVSINNSRLSSDEFQEQMLKNYNIAVVAGSGYGKSCDKFIRISIGTETLQTIFSGIDKIRELIDKT